LHKDHTLVLIAAYNEEKKIRSVIEAVRKNGFFVLVVDDGSRDKTVEEIKKTDAHLKVHHVNQGKGAALRSGFEWFLGSDYKAVIIMDADGQHKVEEIHHFLEALALGHGDVIVGNRMQDRKGMSLVRICTNRGMSWILSKVAGQHIPDTQCGYRALTRRAVESLQITSDRFEAESEMLLQLSKKGHKIASVPVSSIYGDEISKIHPVRDTIRFFRFLARHLKK
jgi:glycosyltransferase involved in cell wall biosynthesis